MLSRSTIQLLRFHFSFFLLPVYLFAISQVPLINWAKAVFVFLILHLLVYPSSNGYNSYMDRDQTPIGGLEAPLQPTRQLFRITILMDLASVILSLWVSPVFGLGILLYILASRLYSYRGIRLKRFPIPGFLIVFIFQGALIFFIVYQGCDLQSGWNVPTLPCVISSMLIGALYPLTQIYQHEEDKRDGVTTISYIAGKRGTFILSMLFFLSATALMYWWLGEQNNLNHFYLFLLILFPVVLFFLSWMIKVWKHAEQANFKNSLRMNLIAGLCTSTFFITLIILKH